MAAAKEVDACVKKFEELLKASDIKQEFEGGICWACLGEDNLKDMNLTYYNNQKPEVYSDLISYCFSIKVEEEMKGTDNVMNLICDKCVQRLRDAADFKALIEVNRATFKTLLCKPIEVSDCLEEYIDEEWLEEEDEEAVLDSSKALPMENATTAEKENNVSNSNDSSRNTIQKKEGAKTVKERRPRHREQLPYKLQKTDRKCKICGEVFSVHKALQMHMPGHFQKHICEQCGRGFATRAQLTSHRVVHAPAVKVCPICPNKVFKASSINRHMRRHQGKADIFIQTVKKEKDVKTVGEKKRRRREELPYKLEKTELECKICGEVFPVHKGLQMHMPSHFQKHICEQCGRGFATRAQLASHATSHRPAAKVCPFCPNKVFKPGSLKKHMQRHQGMKEAYKCAVCNIRFPSYNARRRHMVTVHGEENYKYSCKHCSKRFCLQSHLSKHVRSVHLQERNHACTLCSSKFFSSRVLKEHMQNHSGEKLFECSVCKKSYARACTLRTHMKIHSGVKAHVCCVCRKSFTQACTLRTHMTTHDKNTSDSSSEP